MLPLIISALGVLGVGGIGAAAVFVPAFGALLLGFLKPVADFLAKVPWYVYAAAAVIGLIAFLTISRGHFIDRAHADEARLASICESVRIADHSPKLDCSKDAAQVILMGQALEATTAAILKQNAAVKALAATSAAEQAKAAQASQEAEQRAKAAQTASESLAASARAPGRSSAPCAPSKTLTDQWR